MNKGVKKMNKELIEEAGDALKLAAEMSRVYYRKPLIITYSGGKDSDVMLQLAIENLKPDEFIVQHNITTVDAPQTNRHINEVWEEWYKTLQKNSYIQEKNYKYVGSDCREKNTSHEGGKILLSGF